MHARTFMKTRFHLCTCVLRVRRPKKRPRLDDCDLCPVVENAFDTISSGAAWSSDGFGAAAAAYASGNRDKTLLAFLSLGNFGRSPQNLERDLHKWVGLEVTPYFLNIQVHQHRKKGLADIKFPVLCPWEMMHWIWKHGPVQFSKSILGETGPAGIR